MTGIIRVLVIHSVYLEVESESATVTDATVTAAARGPAALGRTGSPTQFRACRSGPGT